MKLKPTPRPRRAPKPKAGRSTRPAARRSLLGGGRQARRPGVPLRQRIAKRMPSIRRALAILGAAAVVAGIVAALNGPWFRVASVEWSGGARTQEADVAAILQGQVGTSVLAVDTGALAASLEALPSVETARVEADLAGHVRATITEPEVAFVWDTRRSRFLGAEDGTLFAETANGALDDALAGVPHIVDDRFVGRRLLVGDRIPGPLLEAAHRILAVDPVAMGSIATRLRVKLDDEYGFRLASGELGWEVALGVYGIDPNETAADMAARLDRQVAAVRTLFAERPETNIGWVDVRNPGKVYFRAKG